MSKVAEGIFTTSGEVDPLEDDSLYTLAWANLDRMKSLFFENAFDKSQLCLEDKHGVVVKEPHGDGCSKPTGLYLAPGRSWIDFAYREKRWQFYKRYLYKVNLVGEGIILYNLNNHDQAIQFAIDFGNVEEDGSISTIRWSDVADKYNGIRVLNWEKSTNKLLNWYNTFEASQVVIWKAKAGELDFTLIADTFNESSPKIFQSPSSIGGNKKKKTKKNKRLKHKRKSRKKGTRRSTSRRARYSRKKRRHSRK